MRPAGLGVNLTAASATGVQADGRRASGLPPRAMTPPAPGPAARLRVLVRRPGRLVVVPAGEVARAREAGPPCPSCGATYRSTRLGD